MSAIDWSTFEEDPDVIIVEGSQRTGAQYHFYMETQSAIAYPTEGGGIKLYASTQEPDNVQGIVAHVCCLPSNQVTVEVSRNHLTVTINKNEPSIASAITQLLMVHPIYLLIHAAGCPGWWWIWRQV